VGAIAASAVAEAFPGEPGLSRKNLTLTLTELHLSAYDHLLAQLVRTLLRTPALQTEQRAEEPAMGDTRLDGRAKELKVKAAHGVRAPGA
jgi:hypothetical protein